MDPLLVTANFLQSTMEKKKKKKKKDKDDKPRRPESEWVARVQDLKAFKERHKTCQVKPKTDESPAGKRLRKFYEAVKRLRRNIEDFMEAGEPDIYKSTIDGWHLTKEREDELTEIGFPWIIHNVGKHKKKQRLMAVANEEEEDDHRKVLEDNNNARPSESMFQLARMMQHNEKLHQEVMKDRQEVMRDRMEVAKMREEMMKNSEEKVQKKKLRKLLSMYDEMKPRLNKLNKRTRDAFREDKDKKKRERRY